MTISHEFVPHLGGVCPQCAKPKRWTLEELWARLGEWSGETGAVWAYLNWLEEQA